MLKLELAITRISLIAKKMKQYNLRIYSILQFYLYLSLDTSTSQTLDKRDHNLYSNKLMGEWSLWKTEHGREYRSSEEELRRFAVWRDNLAFIEEHNRRKKMMGYTLGMNHFGDIVSRAIQAII